MGNTVDLTVIGAPDHVDHARRRIEELESRWSRFIFSSDISRLNRADGRPTAIHHDTVVLVRYLVEAQRVTNGAFDPTLAPTLNALGYRASRTHSADDCELSVHARSSCNLSTTTIDDCFDAVTLPFGATLDPGGLGKGLAADIVTSELMARGASGVCLSIGGDIRCAGLGPIDGHWVVDIADPARDDASVSRIWLNEGAVATSSLTAKEWIDRGSQRHHVIDPRQLTPITIDAETMVQASVIAREAVWAEVFATSTLVTQNLESADDLAALVVHRSGRIESNEQWSTFSHE